MEAASAPVSGRGSPAASSAGAVPLGRGDASEAVRHRALGLAPEPDEMAGLRDVVQHGHHGQHERDYITPQPQKPQPTSESAAFKLPTM